MTYETFMVAYFQELTSWGTFAINVETTCWSSSQLEVKCSWKAGRDPAAVPTHGGTMTETVSYLNGPDPEGSVQNAMFRLMTLAVLQAKKTRLNLRLGGRRGGDWDGLAGLSTWDTAKLELHVQPLPPAATFIPIDPAGWAKAATQTREADDRLDALSLALRKGITR